MTSELGAVFFCLQITEVTLLCMHFDLCGQPASPDVSWTVLLVCLVLWLVEAVVFC